MSDSLKKASIFPGRNPFSPEGPRASSRARVTEQRAVAQRQKIERQRAQRAEQIEQKSHQPAMQKPAPKAGAQMTPMSRALDAYIQDHVGGNRSKKTIEWHQTALGLFSTYLAEQEQILLVTDIDALHITGWFAYLRTTVGGHGKIRSERTIQTYARSVRAFCHWLVRRRLIPLNPFDDVTFPKVGRPLIKMLEEEEFEKLHSCHSCQACSRQRYERAFTCHSPP